MTAIPGCTDQQIDSAVNYLDGIRRRTAEQSPLREAAYIGLAAIHQCQAAVWGEEMHDYIDAPSGRQIAEGFKEPGKWKIEGWSPRLQAWVDCSIVWHKDSDIPNPGYRLVPIKPRIEWVPFLRALGRISAKFPAARFEKVIKDRRNGAIVIVTDTSRTVEPDSHGMVEVLIEDEQ